MGHEVSGVEPVVVPDEAIDRAVAFLRVTQSREVETDDDQ